MCAGNEGKKAKVKKNDQKLTRMERRVHKSQDRSRIEAEKAKFKSKQVQLPFSKIKDLICEDFKVKGPNVKAFKVNGLILEVSISKGPKVQKEES